MGGSFGERQIFKTKNSFFFSFFFFLRTQVLFVGQPLFWTSGDVCPRFQSQGGSLDYY